MNVTAHTLEPVKTVFVELFCSPTSSKENPSLRVSGHGGSRNRTFVVENYPEDVYGQWTTDEVTGEQGCIDDERSCFWTWDDNEHAWQSRQFKGRQVNRRKGKGKKKKARVDSKELVMHTLVKNKHMTMIGGHKKKVFGGPRARKAGKACRKERTKSLMAILVPSIKKKVQAMNYTCTKAEARIRRTCKKVPFPNQDFLLQKHRVKKDMAIPGNQTIGIPA